MYNPHYTVAKEQSRSGMLTEIVLGASDFEFCGIRSRQYSSQSVGCWLETKGQFLSFLFERTVVVEEESKGHGVRKCTDG